jgi:hypothetical protein
MVLKSIGVLSCGKLMGILNALLGVLIGGFFALISLAGVALQQAQGGNGPVLPFMGMGVGAVIVFPIFYGIIGFIGGIIMALLYNAVANIAGGLELEFEPLPQRYTSGSRYRENEVRFPEPPPTD